MFNLKFCRMNRILEAEPTGAISAEDFREIAAFIDPEIDWGGPINGVLIHTRTFPGWEGFGALIEHVRFVKNHHDSVRKVAMATDDRIGRFLVEKIVSHFVSADVRLFRHDELEVARKWVSNW